MELGFMLSFLLLRLAWLLPSSSYGMVSPSSGEDPWWMTQVEGRSKSSCLNKLDEACYSADLVSSQFFLYWLGAREEDRELLVSAAAAAWWGELRQGYSSCPESCVRSVLKPLMLRRSELEEVGITSPSPSFNKLALTCNFSGGGADLAAELVTRRGDEGEGMHRFRVCVQLEARQGRSSASLGSSFTAVFSSLSSVMVERRPLPPSTSATAASGRRSKDIYNLQAVMPLRRPLGYDVAGSRLPVPSGVVPGDVEVGCIKLWIRRTGEGAGPNCIPQNFLRVLCASCKGLSVISKFLTAFSVKCTGVEF